MNVTTKEVRQVLLDAEVHSKLKVWAAQNQTDMKTILNRLVSEHLQKQSA